MKSKALQLSKFLLIVVLLSPFALPANTSAISGWNAGRIINDDVFTNHRSMSVNSIQSFLDSKVPNCDTYGRQLSEYGGPDLNNDGKVQRWEWAKANYNQTKFTCLKDWKKSSNGYSAARVIYNKANDYNISPKVLIVLLQKEQGLVTDAWPLSQQYRTATGYGCPDTAPCDSQYYGLANQLDWAAKMFRAIIDDSPTWYTPYELGNNYIQYNPSSSCGGSVVNIENRSTQALYNYTPYQPNRAALNAGWGAASCGAYGNRNFFLYFTNWFGRPNIGDSYSYSVVSQELYSDAGYTTKLADDSATINKDSAVYAKITVKNTGNQVWYQDFLKIGTLNTRDRVSAFSDQSWPSGSRPSYMEEDSVAAGGTATFKFRMMAPSDSYKEYSEHFGVVIEGQRWLPGSFAYNLTVQDPNPAYSVQNTKTTVAASPTGRFSQEISNIESWPDNLLYVTAEIKNTGNRVLPANLTKIGTTSPKDRASDFRSADWLSSSRVTAIGGAIKPGQIGTFKFTLATPDNQGTQEESFGIVVEGQQWVAGNIINLTVNTGSRPPSSIAKSKTVANGEYLASPNNRFRLVLQADGNLVLYSVTTGRPLWHTYTNGRDASVLRLQNDGNLVLYNTTGRPLWHTYTNGRDASVLRLQNDGNLVLYNTTGRPLWHTYTNGSR